MSSGRYDHPENIITRSAQMDRVAITSSALSFAKFHARALMYVTNIIVGIRSVASIAALNMAAQHHSTIAAAVSAISGATLSWVSATSVGSYHTLALNRTMNAGEALSLIFNDAKGKVFVEYQYQLLPTVS